MATDLPSEFDVVVLGTGLPESIVAAAFSRNGYKVLHLDRNPYYSSSWASFSLSNLEGWAKSFECSADNKPDCDFGDLLKENETIVRIPSQAQDISNVKTQYHVRETSPTVLASVNPELGEDKTSTGPEIASSQKNSSVQEQNSESKPDCADGAGDNLAKKNELDSLSQTVPVVSGSDIVDSALDIEKENLENKQDIDNSEQKEEHESSQTVPGSGSVESSACTNTKELLQEESSKVTSLTKETTKGTHEEHQDRKIWTVTDIKNEWRKFNLDLAPKILYSTSQTVDLLISSDVAKYCEFRTVSRVLTLLNGQLEKVPCSRSDVFGSRKVSVLEKRMLMKFLTSCAQSEENPEFYEDFKEKPFCTFLKAKKLTPNILHFVQHSIAMVTDEVSTEEGMKKIKRFLVSLGRYGNTAFLFPLYGSGELPQAFCRLCAVFGGTYCLQMSASALVINDKRCCAVITSEGQRIDCKHVILGPTYSPVEYIHTDGSFLSRGILLTDKSILHEDTTELSLLYLIPEKSAGLQNPITVLELPPSSMVCPKDMNVVHLTLQGRCEAKADLASTVTTLFTSDEADESKPSILWSLYYTQQDLSNMKTSECKPDNVYIMPGPGTDLDMDLAVQEARRVWEMVCPEEEFLPKPPNPEDIIYVDDEETKVGEGTGSLKNEADLDEEDITDKCSINNEDQSQNSQSVSSAQEGKEKSSLVSETTPSLSPEEGKEKSSLVSETTPSLSPEEGKEKSSLVSESTPSLSPEEGKENSSLVSESTPSLSPEVGKENSSLVSETTTSLSPEKGKENSSNLQQNDEKNTDSAS